MVRLLAGTVTAVFLLVTARWLRDDLRGQRQRVARIEAGVLYLTTPTGPRVVPLGEVAFALWRDDLDVTNGLWFYDRRQQVLAHLDLRFLPDLAAARAFAAWLQLHAPQLEVRWPGQSRL